MTIDLNCDMGEGIGNDELIMPFVSSANIACGYHAGSDVTMRQTAELATMYKVSVGAHVSFFDKENFGRTEIHLASDRIYDLVFLQLRDFARVLESLSMNMHHVKPHGALYNMSAKDPSIAHAIARAVKDFDPGLILFGLAGSCSVSEGDAMGLKTANEVFADRTYQDDGSLTPRSRAGALIEDPEQCARQALVMINERKVQSLSGKSIPISADTICIHGDGRHAIEVATSIYETLKENNIQIEAI